MHLEDYEDRKIIKLEEVDKWILDRVNTVIEKVTKYYEQYNYSKARNAIDNFFWKDFADNYMEFIKYRLYSEDKVNEDSRHAAKFTLHNILLILIKLYAPILPHITEEIYQIYFAKKQREISIHISKWPKINLDWPINDEEKNEFIKVLGVVEEIRKYKSEKQISMGKEVTEYTIKTKELPDIKYQEFIKNVLRINRISNYEK
jgi:valyl-tRNA synthetase